MITKIKLKNFQSHANTTLELTEGVNAIVGQSDSGKSAVIRALRWLTFNKPSSAGLVRHGETDMSVAVVLDGATKVIRKQKKQAGSYELKGEDGNLTFNALNKSVPEEIISKLNMSELNFQSQFDSHFLLSNTAGEVARTLNSAINLEIIDTTIAALNSQKLEISRGITELENNISRTTDELKKYDGLTGIREEIENLKLLEYDIDGDRARLYSLEVMVDEYDNAENVLENLPDVKGMETTFTECSMLIDDIQADYTVMDLLQKFNTDYHAFTMECSRYEQKLHDVQNEYNELYNKLKTCPVCDTVLRKVER